MKTNYNLCLVGALLGSQIAFSQIIEFDPVTDEMLANPPLGEWLSWRGNQNSWGYSPLDQINSNNVNQLQLVWSWAFDDTGAGQAAPLIHNGVMFIPGPVVSFKRWMRPMVIWFGNTGLALPLPLMILTGLQA